MAPSITKSILASFIFTLSILNLSAATNPSPDTSVLMPNTDTGGKYVVGLWAEIDEAAPSITLHLYRDSDYEVYRRVYGESDWGAVLATLAPGTFSWTDNNVQEGVVYEYAVKDLSPLATWGASYNGFGENMGYQLASIRADQDQDRGIVILAVADSAIEGNESKLHRLVEDMVGDGWRVRIVYANSHYDFAWDFDDIHNASGFYGYDSVRDLRRQIQRIYHENPGEVKMLYCLGHVPFAQTGLLVGHTDGHGPRSAYVTDFIYADVDGQYTDSDTSSPSASIDNETDNPRTGAHVPWDGIYDQNNMASRLEIGVGRVDPFNVPGATDAEHLSKYLDKAHNYRHTKPYGMAGSEVVMNDHARFRWNSQGQRGAVATSMQLLSMFGPAKLQNYLPIGALPAAIAPNTDDDVQYLINTGPYLFYAQNNNKPPNADVGSKAAHRLSMQSNWNDWWSHQDNQSVKDIFRDTNMTLSWLCTGRWSPQFLNYPLGLGFPYGDVLKLSANYEHGEYFTGIEPNLSMTVREFVHTYVGDPTLRLFPVEPISNLTATPVANTVQLSWDAPADLSQFEAYRVYRSNDLMGDFQLIASDLSNTSFTDNSPLSGSNVYMVKAVHLVESGSGSFLNNAQGIFATVGMSIDTTVLPPFPIGEDANFSLQVSNAAGAATWSLVSGYLPLGMTLAADGTLSGNPISAGHYDFELEVTDGVSTIRRQWGAFVDSAESVIASVDLREDGFGLVDKSYYQRQITVHGSPQWDPEGGMIFDGVDDAIELHDMANDIFPHYTLFPTLNSSANGFALVAAFKADASSSGGAIMAKALDYAGHPNNHSQYAVRMNAAGKIECRLRHAKATSSQSYNDGQWHSVAFVRIPGQSPKLYIDGISVATVGTSSTNLIDEDFLIGARWNGNEASGVTDVFEGSIADVMVYKTGISEGEIMAIHERRTQSRADITAVAPVISTLPASLQFADAAAENTFSLPFTMSDANGEPVKPVLIPDDITVWKHLAVDATDTGYILQGQIKEDQVGHHNLSIMADDGWPGPAAKHTISIEVAGLVDDSVTLPIEGGLIDVMANDVPLTGESLTLLQVSSQPFVGYARVENGQIRYYPTPLWSTSLSFQYEAETQSGVTLEAQVTVNPANIPAPQNDSVALNSAGSTLIDVLANDAGPLGESLVITRVTQPQRGKTRIVNGQIEYTTAAGDESFSDSFVYYVKNESGFIRYAFVNVSFFNTNSPTPTIAFDFDEGTGITLSNSGTLGGGISGQINGTASWETRNGGHALVFDGSTTYVDLGNPTEMSVDPASDSFSFSMMLKPEDYSVYEGTIQALISKESGTGTNEQFGLEIGSLSAFASYITSKHPSTSSETHGLTFSAARPDRWGTLNNPGGGNSPPIEPEWHLLVCTYDVSNHLLRFYVDNWMVAQATIAAPAATPDNALNWLLGARRDGSGGTTDFYSGAIDNFKFFDYALNPLEIKVLLEDQGFSNANMSPYINYDRLQPLLASTLEIGKTYNIVFPVEDMDSEFKISGYYLDPSFNYHTYINGLTLTPDTPGNYTVYFRYTQNDAAAQNSHSFPLSYTVGAVEDLHLSFAIDPDQSLSDGVSGQAYNETIQLIGGTAPVSFSAQNLPTGLSLNPSTGELTGSIAAAGNYGFSVTATDANTDSDSRHYLISILPADTDNDGLSDNWETLHMGDLSSGSHVDDDNDGRPALIEFAAGSLPNNYDASSLIKMKKVYGPVVDGSDHYMQLEFDRKSDLPGAMTYKVQLSSDMLNWSDVSEPQYILSDDGSVQKVQLRVPMGADDKHFYRIQVQHNP